jgi:hypothetical protein
MEGDLADTPADDVCRVLASADATGVLEIEGPDGHGAIVWRDGDVVAATSPAPRARLAVRPGHAGAPPDPAAVRLAVREQTIDAVLHLVRWRYGDYRFRAGATADRDDAPEVTPALAVEPLLAEVARRRREWDEIERLLPDLEAVPRLAADVDPDGDLADAGLGTDARTCLAAVDGTRSVHELTDELGLGRYGTARVVHELHLAGLVEIVLPEDEVGRALEDALRQLDVASSDAAPGELAEGTDRPPAARAGAPEPEAAAEPASLDSPPSVVDVARLLAELETDVAGPAHADEPPAATGPDEPATAAVETPADDAPADDAPADDDQDADVPGGADQDADADVPGGAEVSELLRELSWLAVEDDDQPATSSRPSRPDRASAGRDDPRKRKRRFGRS